MSGEGEFSESGKTMLMPEVFSVGFDKIACKRVCKRIDFIETEVIKDRLDVESQRMTVEEFIAHQSDHFLDLMNTCKEFFMLTHVSFQSEQGLITPPNDPARSAETPAMP